MGSTPFVQYTYSGAGNGSRLASMVYPNGRTINYDYGNDLTNTNAALDNAIGRLDAIVDGPNSGDAGQVLEQYSYLGLSTIVARNHPQTGINLTYLGTGGTIGSGGDRYVGLDQFGRIADQNWVRTSSGKSTDNFSYSYDNNSNVTAESNLLDAAYSQAFTYDPLNRLASNTLGGAANQSWTLDSQGNWSSFTSNGITQTQTANAQNQITSISGTSATPTYDPNGNMISDQSGNTLTYDAWNRLVKVTNSGGQVVAQFTYDAGGRRITESYPQGNSQEPIGTVKYLYYSNQGQVIEERWNGTSASSVQFQYVWSASYVNAMVLRDGYSGGVLQAAARVFPEYDANYNVTSLLTYNAGLGGWVVSQRFVYDAYGQVTKQLNAFWDPGGLDPDWYYLFQGMRYTYATGLYHAGYRDYSPTLGRWINQDPLQYINGANTYQFVESNPVGYVDSFGLAARGRFPDNGAPNSFSERVGPDGKVTSRAFYNSKGQMYNRQDYTGKAHGETPTPHEQVTTFNENGQPNGKICNGLDPNTVDQTPGSGVKASPTGGLPTDLEDIAEDISKTFETDILFPLQVTIFELQIGNSPPAGGPSGAVYH